MKRILTILCLVAAGNFFFAQTAPAKLSTDQATEQQIKDIELQWAIAIQRQDTVSMSNFLSEKYFLAIGVQGESLKIVPRNVWLNTLKFYVTNSFKIDDIQVHLYGDTAVALMLYSQKAIVHGQDRSAQFLITDIWVKETDGWRVAERHSSRPEQPIAARP